MSRIESMMGTTRGEILGMLRRSACSVNDLAAALGITDNAVRTHLAGMQRDGMVQPAGMERATGGKPAQLFEITAEAEEMYPKAYAFVLSRIVELLQEQQGAEWVESLLRTLGSRAAPAGATDPSTDVASRVEAAADVLRELGGDVAVVQEEGGWKIRGFGCPLSGVVSEHATVCTLAESLVAEITGQPVRECCDRSGRPRCAFRVGGGSIGCE